MNFATLTVTASELGDVLDLSDRRIRQYAEEGIFERVERGKYGLRDCVLAYIAATATDDSDELRRERIALMKVQRRRIELQNEFAEATEHDLSFQDSLIETLTMYWHLQSRQIAGWLYGELNMREGIRDEARAIAGEVQNWLIGLRAEIASELKTAAAEARRKGIVIRDHGDLNRLLGKELDEE